MKGNQAIFATCSIYKLQRRKGRIGSRSGSPGWDPPSQLGNKGPQALLLPFSSGEPALLFRNQSQMQAPFSKEKPANRPPLILENKNCFFSGIDSNNMEPGGPLFPPLHCEARGIVLDFQVIPSLKQPQEGKTKEN